MNITYAAIGTGVAAAMKAVPSIKRAMSPDKLTESIPDVALAQVYPETGETSKGSTNDRLTMRGGIRINESVWNIDVYARVRSHIGEDMAKVITLMDDVTLMLEAQNTQPYFGLQGIKAFAWRWQRTTFAYGDPEVKYAGIRFILTFTIF